MVAVVVVVVREVVREVARVVGAVAEVARGERGGPRAASTAGERRRRWGGRVPAGQTQSGHREAQVLCGGQK